MILGGTMFEDQQQLRLSCLNLHNIFYKLCQAYIFLILYRNKEIDSS